MCTEHSAWVATLTTDDRIRIVPNGAWRAITATDPLTVAPAWVLEPQWHCEAYRLSYGVPYTRGMTPVQITQDWLSKLTPGQPINLGTATPYEVVSVGRQLLKVRNTDTGRCRSLRGYAEIARLMHLPPTYTPPQPREGPYQRKRRLAAEQGILPPAPNRPRRAMCYRMYDKHGVLLYVGHTVDPTQRMEDHKSKPWRDEVSYIRPTWYDTEQESADAEKDAIFCEFPVYNKQGVTQPYVSPVRRTG